MVDIDMVKWVSTLLFRFFIPIIPQLRSLQYIIIHSFNHSFMQSCIHSFNQSTIESFHSIPFHFISFISFHVIFISFIHWSAKQTGFFQLIAQSRTCNPQATHARRTQRNWQKDTASTERWWKRWSS